MKTIRIRHALLCGAALLVGAAPAFAEEKAGEKAGPLQTAVDEAKPIFAARLRYEGVDQDNLDETADALTYRLRVGFETGAAYDTKFLIEFDHVEALVDDYNSTINGKTEFPVVADPEVTELNRLQLTNTSIEDTTLTLGRQRINFDDQRFVGSVGWRQNEQTLDGLRVTNTAIAGVTIDAAYITQINRIFGDDSPAGRWEGDTYLVNASAKTPLGKLTGFGYLLDVEEVGGLPSSQTYGFRLAGKQKAGEGAVSYVLSAAQQSDYGSSPVDYEAPFYSAEATYALKGFSAGIGYEVLGGDDERAFQTPLATLHKFQGWADKFLVTPVDGVEDLYVKAAYKVGDVGALKGVRFLAVYHAFEAEASSTEYGTELNLLAGAKWQKFGFTVKYADYMADEFSVDTQKLWLQVDYAF